jgi:VanZ family protein
VPGSFARAWLPVILWCAVIFALSAVPSLRTGLGAWDLIVRKLAHVTEYAVLAALLVRATKQPPVALLLGTLYAASDEFHQTFVRGREGRPRDIVIDAVGLIIGVLATHRVSARRVTA